jgi:hypothetical protein
MIMVEISTGLNDDVGIILLCLYPKQGFNKGHVEVYRASVYELLQFHHSSETPITLICFIKCAKITWIFLCMNAMHTSVASIL